MYAGSYTVGVKDANGCITSKIISITDNGGDEFEGTGPNKNSTKAKAFTIPIETVVNARIPALADSVDWYKFTIPATGNYSIAFSHPNAAIVFDAYSASGSLPLSTLPGSTSNAKLYSFTGGTVYYIKVYGGLSFICYQLSVQSTIPISQPITSSSSIQNPIVEQKKIVTSIVADLAVKAFPNPHQGKFILEIVSSISGVAKVELFTASGQKLQSKMVNVLQSVTNTIPLSVSNNGIIFYKVQIGKHTSVGKVLGGK